MFCTEACQTLHITDIGHWIGEGPEERRQSWPRTLLLLNLGPTTSALAPSPRGVNHPKGCPTALWDHRWKMLGLDWQTLRNTGSHRRTLLADNSRTTASPGASTQKLLDLAIVWDQSAGRGHQAGITLGNWHRWGGAGSKSERGGKGGHQQRSVRASRVTL